MKLYGSIAQSVEQRTENPRVPGSIPGRATKKAPKINILGAFYSKLNFKVELYLKFSFFYVKIKL